MPQPLLEANLIAPGLLVGSAPPLGSAVRHSGVDVLVLCAEEFQPSSRNFPGVLVIHAPFDDGELDEATRRMSREAASRVALHMQEGRTVLVTCMAGRNRSALVAALALMRLTGLPGAEWAAHLRRKRRPRCGGEVLSNPDFYDALQRA